MEAGSKAGGSAQPGQGRCCVIEDVVACVETHVEYPRGVRALTGFDAASRALQLVCVATDLQASVQTMGARPEASQPQPHELVARGAFANRGAAEVAVEEYLVVRTQDDDDDDDENMRHDYRPELEVDMRDSDEPEQAA